MARPSHPDKDAVLAALRSAFAKYKNEKQLRLARLKIASKYPHVERRTYQLWIRESELPAAAPTPVVLKFETPNDAKPKAKPQRKAKEVQPEPPANDPPDSSAPHKTRQALITESTVKALAGDPPKTSEKSGAKSADEAIRGLTTKRFMSTSANGLLTAYDLIDRAADLYLDAEALRDCSIQLVDAGDRHVILDPTSYAVSIDLRRKLLALQTTLLEKAHDLHAVEAFCSALINRIGLRSRPLAIELLKDMQVISKSYGAKTWREQNPDQSSSSGQIV